MPSFYDPKNMLFNPDTAFDQNDDELYLGTWFGFDAWGYKTSRFDQRRIEWSVLLVDGNEPGNYMTWVGASSWFASGAVMGTANGTIPMVDHLTKSEKGLAYLMAFAALHHHPKNK